MSEDSDAILQRSKSARSPSLLESNKPTENGRSKRNFLLDVRVMDAHKIILVQRQSITVENLKIKDKEMWADSDFCALCDLKFNSIKLKNQHHCRVCGESVCKDCSTKQINNQRACDFCFLKCSDHKQVRRRKKDLNNITEQIDGLMEAMQRYDQNQIEINGQIFENQEKQKEDLRQFSFIELEIENEIKKLQNLNEIMAAEIETQKSKATVLEQESAVNKADSTELNIQIKKLEIDIESQQSCVEMKIKEVENIRKLLQNVQNSESFRDLSTMRSRIDSDASFSRSNHSVSYTQNQLGTMHLGFPMEKIAEGAHEEEDH